MYNPASNHKNNKTSTEHANTYKNRAHSTHTNKQTTYNQTQQTHIIKQTTKG